MHTAPPAGVVIRAEKLSRRFGKRTAVAGIDLEVAPGEVIGLLGSDGAGKTTTLQMLAAILDPSAGRATVLGHDTLGEAAAITARIGYMSQAFSLYGRLTVDENIEFFARLHRVPPERRGARKAQLLGFARLAAHRDRLARQLSGGMQKKLALCCALIHEPPLLILDEPTTGVDPVSRRELWDILYETLGRGTTIIVSTPYMDEAERCTRVALLHEGQLIACDAPQRLRAALPRPPGTAVPTLEDVFIALLPDVAVEASDVAVDAAPAAGNAVEVEHLTMRFGAFTAVDDVSFNVRRGEIFGFLGANGSGKTTTIKMLCGLLAPSAGRARVAGHDLAGQTGAVKSRVGYMSQRFSLYDDMTVAENLNFFAGVYSVPRGKAAERRHQALRLAGLQGEENRLVRGLSGGVKQRLALACAVLHEPEVLFLDEPTAGVDPRSRRRFWELIGTLAGRGVTVFVTTHYMDEAEHCHRLGLLHNGRLVALGSPRELRENMRAGEMLELECDRPIEALKLFRGRPGIKASFFGDRLHLLVDDATAQMPRLAQTVRDAGHTLSRIEPVPLSIEDVFLAFVEMEQSRLGAQAAT